MPRWCNKSFKDSSRDFFLVSSIGGGSSNSKCVNSPNPELRNPVGKDAESIFKATDQLSDKELEKWARESYMDMKGFIRQ